MPIANVVDGQVQISESSQTNERKTNSTLGKEDFLQLLITQMKYQDPLDPADNTEFVAQLAQFSELEAMQNMSETLTNTSAFSLVGKYVYVEDQTEGGFVNKAEGVVEYVTMQNGKAYVSIDGELYSYDSIVEVRDEMYVISQYLPTVKTQEVVYRHHDPQDVEIKGINLGSDGYQASSFAVAFIDGAGNSVAIPTSYLTYKDGTLTIDKEVFKTLEAGTYLIAFVFDDPNQTVIYDSVKLTVKGIRPEIEEDPEDGIDGGTEDTEGTEDADGNTDGVEGSTGSTDGTENSGNTEDVDGSTDDDSAAGSDE